MKKNKIISFILVAALLTCLLPANAKAADDNRIPVIKKATREKGVAHIEWNYVNDADGYFIQYSTSPKFLSYTTTTEEINYGFISKFDKKNTDMSTELYVRICSYEDRNGYKAKSSYSKPIMFTGWDDFDDEWSRYSVIHSQSAVIFFGTDNALNKQKTVCIDPMFGTEDSENKEILVQPRGGEKLLSDYIDAGVRTISASMTGTTFDAKDLEYDVSGFENDGRRTDSFSAKLGNKLMSVLISKKYNVMLIRNSEKCKLDDPARCVLANKYADLHLCFYYSTDLEKDGRGVSYYLTPSKTTYGSVEGFDDYFNTYPISNTKLTDANKDFAKFSVDALKKDKVKINETECIESDTLQSYYSEIPLAVFILGGRIEAHTNEETVTFSRSFATAVDKFFKKYPDSFR